MFIKVGVAFGGYKYEAVFDLQVLMRQWSRFLRPTPLLAK